MEKKARVVPEEHKDFFDEYFALLKKYPKAGERYALADRGTHADPGTQSLAHVVQWECEEFGDGTPGLDCKPKLE
jgi:hypothetical protein